MPEKMLLFVFILNIALILLDATIGYYVAPRLMSLASSEENDTGELAVSSIRKMLAGVVTLYMFFNCLAYFRRESSLMMIVSALVLLDLGGQLYMRRRAANTSENDQ